MAGSSRLRVLVVEDLPDVSEGLKLLLIAQGLDAVAADNGASALAALESFRPDVILLDIGLPGMSGYEVAMRIRNEIDFRHTPIIAVKGMAPTVTN